MKFACPKTNCAEVYHCDPGTAVTCISCGTEFIAKTFENSETASTGAVRSTLYPKGAKFPARYDLMMRNAVGMRRLAEAWGEGNVKYGPDNWMGGFPESVYICHITEHMRLHLAGDTSEDHMAHIAWNALALAWVQENKPELLDLTKPEQKL